MQDWAKEDDSECRFRLSKTHKHQLIKRKKGILKQQVKLLTGETTLSGGTQVLSQALIYLNDQPREPVTPMCQTADLCQDTQYHKDIKFTGDSHCPAAHHGSTCYGTENTKPQHSWERH